MTAARIRQNQAVVGWGLAAVVTAASAALSLLAFTAPFAFDFVDLPSLAGELPFLGFGFAMAVAVSRYRSARVAAEGRNFRAAWSDLVPSRGKRLEACAGEARLAWEAIRVAGCLGSPAVAVAAHAPTDAEIQAAVASALGAARKRLAMTQEHLAQAAVASVRTVQRAEANGRLAFENLRGICSVLGIPVPVPEGREAAVERPAAWRGIGQPIALALALQASCIIGAGWFWETWRARCIHLAAAAALSGGVAWLGRDIYRPSSPGMWDIYAGIASMPLCLGAGSVLLGIAWRAASSRNATLATMLACSIQAVPGYHLGLAGVILEQRAIAVAGEMGNLSAIRQASAFGEARVDRECQTFLAKDAMDLALKPDLTGIPLDPNQEARFVSSMLETNLRRAEFHLRPEPAPGDMEPGKWHRVWQECVSGAEKVRAEEETARRGRGAP